MILLGRGVDVLRQHPTSAKPRHSVQAAHESAPKNINMGNAKGTIINSADLTPAADPKQRKTARAPLQYKKRSSSDELHKYTRMHDGVESSDAQFQELLSNAYW